MEADTKVSRLRSESLSCPDCCTFQECCDPDVSQSCNPRVSHYLRVYPLWPLPSQVASQYCLLHNVPGRRGKIRKELRAYFTGSTIFRYLQAYYKSFLA